MKAPFQWLNEYVSIPVDTDEFARRMIMTGTEVEDIEQQGKGLEKVVAARIEHIEPHPDSDHLQICTMNIGQAEPVIIVTGAQNVFEGAYVPAALDGADLPCGIHIKPSKLRGVPSYGMLCSGEELGVTEEMYAGASVNGILILHEAVAPGTPIAQVFGLTGSVIDFKITANRSDCLSVVGLAREAAAVLGSEFKMPSLQFSENGESIADYLRVQVQASDLCPRYMARVVKNVRLAPSPKWMQDALQAAGVRAINNIVDITNYVMLELGQPMHAFDYRHVSNGEIIVRRATPGEELETLDEKVRTLQDSMLVIADAEKPIGLAGIMGGQYSGILDDTTTVVFESANFEWSQIRVTGRTLGMRTESSARYEKGLPPQLTQVALDRAMALICQLGCGEVVGGCIDICAADLTPVQLQVPVGRINALLGQQIPAQTMVELLQRLQFTVALQDDTLDITVPYWRRDMEHFADIAEEVQRLYGFDTIPSVPTPSQGAQGGRSDNQSTNLRLKHMLAGLGLNETCNYSFMAPGDLDKLMLPEDHPLRTTVRLMNPLGEEYSLMRTTLVPALLKNAQTNAGRKTGAVRLFELNRVFLPKALPLQELPREEDRLALLLHGDDADFFTLKALVQEVCAFYRIKRYQVEPGADVWYHPGRSATLKVSNRPAGQFGELHPQVAEALGLEGRVYVAELDLNMLYEKMGRSYTVVPLPKYPAVTRDLSVSVDAAQNIGPMLDAIVRAGGKLLEKAELFDVYQGVQAGEGRKSVAFKLTLRSPERTLVDEDANKVFAEVVRVLEKRFQAQLRK